MCLTSVRLGTEEPFQYFVVRLQETVSRMLGSSYAEEFVQQLAFVQQLQPRCKRHLSQ